MKIGFVSNLYGTPRGHSYVVKQMVESLIEEQHEIHMYRIRNNEIMSEFPMPTTLETEQSCVIPKNKFIDWLKKVKPDYCVFNEYKQWWEEDHDKLDICKEHGVKTIGYNVWEKLDWNKLKHYKKYDKLIAPTRFQTKLMRKQGLYQTSHIPWGVNIEKIEKIPMSKEDNKIRFFHCAGSGGVDNRKNTQAVINAYKKIEDENTDLLISNLNLKVFSWNEIISFMKYSDVLINASKWESIGIPMLEANACGIPVITSDFEPMNEIVQDRINGFLVEGEIGESESVGCPSFNVDEDDLSKKMSFLKQELILQTMKNNSFAFAKENFDWNKNKKHFIKLFEENNE